MKNTKQITKIHKFDEKEKFMKLINKELTVAEFKYETKEELLKKERALRKRISIYEVYKNNLFLIKRNNTLYVIRKDILYEH